MSAYAKSWLFSLIGLVLLLPANLLPIMTVSKLNQGEPSTIAEGVIHLFHAGMYGIAALVFIASIFVPVLKLTVIISLLIALKLEIPVSERQCTILFRFIQALGPWSMLDIFMIAVLASLVSFGSLAVVHAEPGATAFAGVVIATMLAAKQFDSKLLWDQLRHD